MKLNLKLTLTLLSGIAIGIAASAVVHAQQAKTPPGYVLAEVEVTDRPLMQQYGAKVPETLAPFNAEYVIRGGKTISLEGDPPKGIVMIAFESMEKAKAWYDSPAYSAIVPIRQRAAKARLFIVEGAAPK